MNFSLATPNPKIGGTVRFNAPEGASILVYARHSLTGAILWQQYGPSTGEFTLGQTDGTWDGSYDKAAVVTAMLLTENTTVQAVAQFWVWVKV